MTIKKSYSYSVLRYSHDNATGEFVNIGVALYSPENSYFDVRIKTTVGRITDLFPNLNSSNFKKLIKAIKDNYKALAESYNASLSFTDNEKDILTAVHTVLPKDDSSFFWSKPEGGISADFSKSLDNLFERYVTKYDDKKLINRRTDTDVWRSFKKELENRRIGEYFKTKTIHGLADEVKFNLAWKNGIWHCVEPISFDLSAAESIKDKAHRWLGQIISVNDSADQFKLYFVVGKPSEKSLSDAFETALNILEKIPVEKEIYFEDDKQALIKKLDNEIKEHYSIG